MGLLQRLFGRQEMRPATRAPQQADVESVVGRESLQEECSPLRDLGDDYVELWFESVHGYSGDSMKPVHLGHQARYYPQESVVQIETWGPEGTRGEEYTMPPDVTEKDDIVEYLYAHGVFVPFEYRPKRLHSDDGAR